MPSIGFEWQFVATDLNFQERVGTALKQIIDVPSKGLVFHWPDPGVKIESDSGEVEIITDPVTTWNALLKQLVLIGEMLVALGMTPPDWARLPDGRMRTGMEHSGFGTGLGIGAAVAEGGRAMPTRKATNVIKYPALVTLDANGHLQLGKTGVVDPEPVVLNADGIKKLFSFRLAAPIYAPFKVVDNAEQQAAVYRPANNRIAVVGMHEGAFNGVPQCTMERSLSELPTLIKPFSAPSVQLAAQWLDGQRASEDLTGFVTMLYYYRAMFGQSTIRTIPDGPKAGFGLLPRNNVRSVYRALLDDADRAIFDALVGTLSPAKRNDPMCPHGYRAGEDTITNNLTWGQWLDSIRLGDAGAGIPTLDDDFAGKGPRGADYDRLSPPRGYPAHAHPARTTAWFTYAMGRVNADANHPVVLLEYRDLSVFGSGARNDTVGYLNFLKVAAKAATEAGL